MAGHDLIVIGGSAGGVETLTELLAQLPADLPAAVCVAIHVSPSSAGVLPKIFTRAGRLPAVHPRDRQPLEPGRVYVAPPDTHLLIEDGTLRLGRGPREHGHRPAIDPLFRSAAWNYGARVLGVLVSGNLDDGTAGLQAVKSRGGIAIVQDPRDAEFPGMPQSAVDNVAADYVVPAADISPLLVRLAHTPMNSGNSDTPGDAMKKETEIAGLDPEAVHQTETLGPPSAFGCPECGGALFELRDGQLVRYRCRVGHAYSPESLDEEMSHSIEAALWTALRALEERVALARRLADRLRDRGIQGAGGRFEDQAQALEAHARVIRKLLLGAASLPTPGDPLAGAGPGKSSGGKEAGRPAPA
jgi:two-component system chemotaxis response regulator CheB